MFAADVTFRKGREVPLKDIVAAVTSFQLGLIGEGLSDVREGHQELLDWIQRWIDGLEENRTGASGSA